MPSARVTLPAANVGQIGQMNIEVDVLTGGSAAPLVTLGDNIYYPEVRAVYARAMTVQGGFGSFQVVRLMIHFESPVPSSANALAVNIFQEDAKQFIYPWFSFVEGSDKAFAGEPKEGRTPRFPDDPGGPHGKG